MSPVAKRSLKYVGNPLYRDEDFILDAGCCCFSSDGWGTEHDRPRKEIDILSPASATFVHPLAVLAAKAVLLHHCRVVKDNHVVAVIVSLNLGWDVSHSAVSGDESC